MNSGQGFGCPKLKDTEHGFIVPPLAAGQRIRGRLDAMLGYKLS